MLRLEQKLRNLLKNAGRVAVLGIGSELRGDDAVGLLVIDHLRKNINTLRRAAARRAGIRRPLASRGPALKLFNGGTAPENLTGEIRRFNPSHLVLVDAVELGKKPGAIAVLNPRAAGIVSFFTHKLPIKLMLDYLAAEIKFTPLLIGIQPRNLEVAAPVSPAARRAVELTTVCLCAVLKGPL